MPVSPPRKKVLVIGLQGLGNLILSSPLLHSLQKTGRCEVSVLVHNRAAAVLMGCYPLVEEVLVATDFGRWGLLRRLRSVRFDAVVVAYPGGPRTSLLAGLSRARLKIGHQGRKPWVARRFLDIALPVDARVHDVDSNRALYAALMEAWQWDCPEGAPDFTMALPLAVEDEAAAWFAGQGLEQRRHPVVGIAPGCGRNQAFKRWPLERFVALATRLKEVLPQVRPVWFFGPDEPELRARLLRELPTAKVTDNPSLPLTLALLSRCQAVVSNDSGQMHMANALGVPSVSVFGPTSEVRTRPRLATSRVITHDLPCRPCYSSNVVGFQCTHTEKFACLTEISVGQMLAALLEVLPGSAGDSSS